MPNYRSRHRIQREVEQTNMRLPQEREELSIRWEENFSLRDIDGAVPVFDGKTITVQKWCDEFEDTSVILGWSDLQKFIFAKRLMKGEPRSLISSERCKSYNEIKRVIMDEYKSKLNSAHIHQRLMNRKKLAEETFQEYVIKMREIGSQIDLDCESTITYIIDGIQDDERNKVILYGATSYQEFHAKLRIYEEIDAKLRKRKSAFKRFQDHIPKNQHSGELPNAILKRDNMTNIRCYACGCFGHKANNCPRKSSEDVKGLTRNTVGHTLIVNDGKDSEEKRIVMVQQNVNKFLKIVNVYDKSMTALIDTGSDINLIREYKLKELKFVMLNNAKVMMKGIGENFYSSLGNIQLKFTLDNEDFVSSFHVVSDTYIPHDIILGCEFLNNVHMKIASNEVTINKIENNIFSNILSNNVVYDDQIDLGNVEIKILNTECNDIKGKLDESEKNYRDLLLEKETEVEELKNVIEKSEKLERKLQNDIIDLKSNNSIITDSSSNRSNITTTTTDVIQKDLIKNLIKKYVNIEMETVIDDEVIYLEEYLKLTNDLNLKLISLEKQLHESNEENEKILHEKDTIQTDLMHYEIECAKLMKNNEILLNEIDWLKSGKLENENINLIEIRKELENELNNIETNILMEKTKIDETIKFKQKEINERDNELAREHEIIMKFSNEIQSMKIKLDDVIKKTMDNEFDQQTRMKYENDINQLKREIVQKDDNDLLGINDDYDNDNNDDITDVRAWGKNKRNYYDAEFNDLDYGTFDTKQTEFMKPWAQFQSSGPDEL